MDSAAEHNPHTDLTTFFQQLRKMPVTHPYHSSTTSTKSYKTLIPEQPLAPFHVAKVLIPWLCIFVKTKTFKKKLDFSAAQYRLVEAKETAFGRTLPIISDRESTPNTNTGRISPEVSVFSSI